VGDVIANSQKLWFDHQGDGKTRTRTATSRPTAASSTRRTSRSWYYRQGDGRHDIHDWFMEATAAGVLLQSELLLISRDEKGDRVATCRSSSGRPTSSKTRRDPKTGLYLGGPACNLLAPSFAGWKNPTARTTRPITRDCKSPTSPRSTVDRAGKTCRPRADRRRYEKRRDLAKQSLPKLITDEGYFLNSIDPDGTKHGLLGAAEARVLRIEREPRRDRLPRRRR
jgi:hypothetical protein